MTQTSDPGHGALLTQVEAAEACGVSRSTIKRRLTEFPHARQDDSGTWRIPVSDLLGAGLHLRPRSATQPSDPVTQVADPGQNGADLDQARAQIATLTTDLAAERSARQIAEATARAYAANLEDLRFTMRALTGRPAPSEPLETPPAPSPPPTHTPEPRRAAEPPPRRRWPWSRRD